MGKPLTKLKIAMLEQDGSIRGTYHRINRNGERIGLGRLYRIVEGYSEARPAEQRLICSYLQKSLAELFEGASRG